MDSDVVIHLSGIGKTHTNGKLKVHALREVNITIRRGEMVAIMGHSGSGKSTLLSLIGCLDRPSAGMYLLDQTDVMEIPENMLAQIRNKKIGFVFQSFNLLPKYTALKNVELPMIYAGASARERMRRATELLTFVGLKERMHHKPKELSGGEQQRVAIARALANNPPIILGDEPTGNLDTNTSAEIMKILSHLHDHFQSTVVIVTHEPDIANLCKRIITLKDGQVKSDRPVVQESI